MQEAEETVLANVATALENLEQCVVRAACIYGGVSSEDAVEEKRKEIALDAPAPAEGKACLLDDAARLAKVSYALLMWLGSITSDLGIVCLDVGKIPAGR